MKKFSIAVATMFTIFFTSCSKEDKSPTLTKLAQPDYKALLEQKVKLQPLSTARTLDNEKSMLKFDTYKEAYEFFQQLNKMSVQSSQIMELASVEMQNVRRDVGTLANSGTDVYHYHNSIVSSATVGSAYLTSISTTYNTTVDLGYGWISTDNGVTKNFQTKQFLGTDATQPHITYSGIGTINESFITMYTSAGSGSYSGSCQGAVMIEGVALSFIVNVYGTFTAVMPANIQPRPPITITITQSLSARAL